MGRTTSKLTGHFSVREMKCKCRRKTCDALPMKNQFMIKLEMLRLEWAKPLLPISAARCGFWNEKQGGAPGSQHLLGNACDFHFDSEDEITKFIQLAEKYDFKGIGRGSRLVHIDDREEHARWGYSDR